MILQAMEFHEFQDCKALLDMLEDVEYVCKYKYDLQVKFEEMLEWFIKTKLGISTRPIPAYSGDKRKINLLELYVVVKREGGHKNVTSNNLWALAAKDMGYDYNDGELMRIMYAMYLDVLVYYYKFKSTQQSVYERETVKSNEHVSRSRSFSDNQDSVGGRRERNMSDDCIPEEEGDHYALFAGNDWHGMKKLQKRRQFDFKQVEKAVDEANRSVLMHSQKYNQV
ncbi:putative transcription factor & chromatin remodeling ARID family [Helianthus annuus]|uniref:Transcription factor & chromatin remodeling ARID family n=1 Tax=Helianthus annuus TaxID=4232 RepID=A0A9K3NGJ5_HELAN|nr:putative transcription factor & chromatin remodeling ARID family [Helianthus annuus]KAJ0550489.1 putative transcription factor & chromatin remodeling ARID family [Helianthus annuus]KAJ0557242.1 putative transcription factor & chromatin remodeling ARID family [Helianthus annuus]KAJ0563447.1 putative transcription factor & chromatin remodeling ARID family [Helianthus annuus]KAJ0728784.1 putative transcription factor & chromatin remodeling ARID family [Helianthus annuus]